MVWDQLARHHARIKDRRILDLFDDAGGGDARVGDTRADDFSVRIGDMLFDYSKTNIDQTGRKLLLSRAENADVAGRREAMFTGEKINETEGRAVLHTALRALDGGAVLLDGVDVMASVKHTLERMETFARGVRSTSLKPPGGGRFEDVVNIGIGGSDLGPAMACLALAPYHDGPRTHFVANVDGADIHDVLRRLNPATTLVIIASKTFTTIETMTNAATARDWLTSGVGAQQVGGHLVALSSASDKTAAWGIAPDRVFGFEDWVGGRYSVWGPIGLALMLAIGPEQFRDFLRGAQAMDRHFRQAPLAANMPVLLALTGIWHNQICGYASRAVLPYDQRLSRLAAYFQQLEMESNGKRVGMDGEALTRHSGPIVWGEPGTNGQHAFYQLIHQGSRIVPCEFLIAAVGHEADLAHHHRLLLANCLAQSQALLRGRSLHEAREMMAAAGLDGAEQERQARHREFVGNRPSTTLMYRKLTPHVLGQIIALYEHRVFVEGVILGLNSFDQWGVELGKELAVALLPVVAGEMPADALDSSTRMLLVHAQSMD